MNKIDNKDNLKIILDDASNLSLNQIRRLLSNMTAPEIAHALESSPPKQRNLLFSLLKTEEEGDVLFELGEEIQQDLVSNISNEELIEAVKELELDEIVDILQNLPEERMNMILSNMTLVDRQRIEIGLTFPDNTAGGLLNTDVISVRPNNSINEVINYLRDQADLPGNTDKIFVVNNENEMHQSSMDININVLSQLIDNGQVPYQFNHWSAFDGWYMTNNWFHRINDRAPFGKFCGFSTGLRNAEFYDQPYEGHLSYISDVFYAFALSYLLSSVLHLWCIVSFFFCFVCFCFWLPVCYCSILRLLLLIIIFSNFVCFAL